MENPAPAISQIVALLSEVEIFKNLSPAVVEKIAGKVKRETYAKGHVLFRRGEEARALYVVASGQISLLGPVAGGREMPFTFIGEGEILGEMALLTQSPRHFTAVLATTAELLILEKKDFESLLEKTPAIGVHLSRVLSERLALTTERGVQELSTTLKQAPRMDLFLSLLGEPRSSAFALNLAVSILEQSRQKTALVDFCINRKSAILEALGWSGVVPTVEELAQQTILELLRKIKITHPSGLDIIPLPTGLLASPKDKIKAIKALNHLRASYNYCLLMATPLSWESLQPFFKEVNQIYLMSPSEAALQNEIYTKLTQTPLDREGEQPREILIIEDGKNSFVNPAKLRLGWSKTIDKALEGGQKPFEALTDTKTLRAIERLARLLINLKVGMALGSGGARGYAIAGILKVLEREKIYPDILAGTSIGALVGALYAKGLSVEEIIEIGSRVDKNWIRDIVFWDLTLPKEGGFLGGIKLQRFFKTLFDDLDFNDLELPFACVATDIKTGEEVILKSGRVIDSVRASLSVPIVWKPYVMGERYLVDGGLVNPVPTSVIKSMGADVLLAVRLTSSPAERKYSLGMLGKKNNDNKSVGLIDVFFHMISTMTHEIAVNKAEIAHLTIHPRIPHYSWTDFDRVDELVAIGEQAAEELLPQVKALFPFFKDYCVTKLKR